MESITINSASDSDVKIRLIGHCIICLKKVNTGPEVGTTEKWEEQAYPEAAPKSLVSTPGFLATFQEIWGILQSGPEPDGNGKCRRRSTCFGISLEKVIAAGSQINVTFSRTPSPTICHQCYNKILAVENMMKVVRHQVRDIQRIVKESRKGGKFAGSAEQIQKTLQVFTLEVDDRGTDEPLDFEDENVNDSNDSDDNFVEEKPKPRRGRGRPSKPKPSISESSMDSAGQEDNSMDCHQDDNTTNPKNKEDPDFQIKSEPQDSDDDDDGSDDGSNFSDECLGAGSSSKSLRSSGRKSSSTLSKKDGPRSKGGSEYFVDRSSARRKWQPIELSDEDIARYWRLKSKTPHKTGSTLVYYCAYGKRCPMKVKNKTFRNGDSIITTNGLEHGNHRDQDKSYGLTVEQREFIDGCVNVGVSGASNILVSFKAKGVPMPGRQQLRCYLKRMKRHDKEKTEKKSKMGGNNEVEGQNEKEDEEKS